MEYNIVIVDDEDIMRDGLITTIDWESMGFKVVAQFEDGREAIEYIDKNPVDVVLTDIKMTFVSGLELAKHIYDRNYPVKVVLLSGYKEFEYAREAVSYNVVNYLLKPISFAQIKKVFGEIKNDLDKEREQRRKTETNEQQYRELLDVLRNQFFTNLALGALWDKDKIEKMAKLLELNLDADKSKCCIFNIFINNYTEFIQNSWPHSKEGFYRALVNLIYEQDKGIIYYPVRNRNGKVQGIAVAVDMMDTGEFIETVKIKLKKTKDVMNTIMGLEVTFQIEQIFESIGEMAQHTTLMRPQTGSAEALKEQTISNDDLEMLFEQQKLIFTHISCGDEEPVKNLFEKIIEQLRPMGIEWIKNYITDFFATITDKLRKMGIQLSDNFNRSFQYSNLSELQNIPDVTKRGTELLTGIISEIKTKENNSKGVMINQIKKFIKENYRNDITLEDVGDHVFLSPVYLSRFFKEQTGENFSDYLIKVRMEKAIEYLNNPCYKVYEVSQKVGYNSTKYFYRLFKKYYNCTPSEYRKRLYYKED